MKHYSIFLPSYTIGTDAYEQMGAICRPYGTRAVVIGGTRAMEAAREELTAACRQGRDPDPGFCLVWRRVQFSKCGGPGEQ